MKRAEFGRETEDNNSQSRQAAGPAAPRLVITQPPSQEESMAEHTVAAGDTLSSISLKYYGSAVREKWMLIYEANKKLIGDNPALIKAGQVLKIPKLASA